MPEDAARSAAASSVVKAALYARVSTDDGRQTISNQLRQLRELAGARDFLLVKEYCDEETGSTASRTCFFRHVAGCAAAPVSRSAHYLTV